MVGIQSSRSFGVTWLLRDPTDHKGLPRNTKTPFAGKHGEDEEYGS